MNLLPLWKNLEQHLHFLCTKWLVASVEFFISVSNLLIPCSLNHRPLCSSRFSLLSSIPAVQSVILQLSLNFPQYPFLRPTLYTLSHFFYPLQNCASQNYSLLVFLLMSYFKHVFFFPWNCSDLPCTLSPNFNYK